MFNFFKTENEKKLDRLYKRFDKTYRNDSIGYPCNQIFDYSYLYKFLKFPLNNIGDPFIDGLYGLNTHEFERDVLKTVAEILEVDFEYWGYLTAGGTEGNIYGLKVAKSLYPQGTLFYSKETHYSVKKAAEMLGMRVKEIDNLDNGEINYEVLKEEIGENKDKPILILANIGTTIKGAIDDIDKIKKILEHHNIKEKYIHADCALSGFILPFVDDPQPFNFKHGVDSLAISGHKMIGSPIPCGVVLTYKQYIDKIAKNIEYIGSKDTTVLGSRDAFIALILWYALYVLGVDKLKEQVHTCLDNAKYLSGRLTNSKIHNILNKNSITVAFPKPSKELVKKYELAPQHTYAHVICMPHVNKKIIDRFVAEYTKEMK